MVGGVTGRLSYFLIEPFIPHEEELYVAISSDGDGDDIFFSMQGGVNVEENWDKVAHLHVDVLAGMDGVDIKSKLPKSLGDRSIAVEKFIRALWQFYAETGFSYLEINPFTFHNGSIVPLDMVAKLDDAEEYWQRKRWSGFCFSRALRQEPVQGGALHQGYRLLDRGLFKADHFEPGRTDLDHGGRRGSERDLCRYHLRPGLRQGDG